MITKDVKLPTDEELTVEECHLSSPYLKAGAFHLGKACEATNNEFMLCRNEEKDPRKCLNEGKAVTSCTMSFFRDVKKNCAQEFTDHAVCVDHSGPVMAYFECRKTQAIFDTCMLEKMNIVRPAYGYFSEVKIHQTKRPKPPPEPPLVYPDALVPNIGEEFPRRPGRYGTRAFGVF